jgi:hypothetical protein
MCEIKKCEKILRSGLTFVGAKTSNQEEVNSSEAVIYHDGKGYTYWQAATMILEEANQLLREDLEQLGVKISKTEENENVTEDTKALNKTNKSIFHFDDTVDSSLVQQSQAAQKPQPEIVDVKTETNIVTETELNNEQLRDVKIESSSESINRGIEALKIEDQPPVNQNTSVDIDMETNSQNSQLDETHIILKAVEKFEKIQSNSAAKTTPKNLNMTVVSQEVLNMCDVFEKNALSGSKKNKTPTQRVKKSLNYSFGDRTLKNILNSPTSPTNSNFIDNDELKQIFATQLPPNSENSNTEKLEILDFFKTLNLTSLNINVINNITELKKLSTAVRFIFILL